MALKSTVLKATLQIADMDRSHYGDHVLTIAQHPSETDERVMVRLLAYALLAPAPDDPAPLVFARGLSNTDEPDLWRHDLSGQLLHWVEVGQPDERRLARACGRAGRVTILAYAPAVAIWWKALAGKVGRLVNLEVLQIDTESSRALAPLMQRTMQLQVTCQDGLVWIGDGTRSIEIHPRTLQAGSR